MRLHLVRRTEHTPQAAFMERYERLMGWAMSLTRGERSDAEDILHDAYVQFQRLGSAWENIDNVDAYLHRVVRNLHLSRVLRRSRNPLVELDSFEYDTLELSVEAVDPFQLASLQRELFDVCEWACERRLETKAASILLLRFYLRYLPSEIALVCRCNRHAIEKSLQLARQELRQVLQKGPNGNRNGAAQIASHRSSEAVQQVYREDHLNEVLLQKIFSGPLGECLSMGEIEGLYAGDAQLGRATLAHITSCRECLERINRHLQLQSLIERDDLTGGPKGNMGGGKSTGRKTLSGNSAPDLLLDRAERRSKVLFEHRPERLSVHLDGERRASLALQGTENEFAIEISRTRQVSFIEVFSEQGLLLAYLPITALSEGGDYAQGLKMEFSEGRFLALELCFSQPRPRIELTYFDPLLLELRDHSRALPAQSAIAPVIDQMKAIDLLHDWWRQTRSLLRLPFRTLPRAVFTVVSLVLIFLLPLLQIKQSTLSAETLLQRADSWQTASEGEQVLHRTFQYSEMQPKSGVHSKERRVEVWRQKNGHILRRAYDPAGRLLATSSTEPLHMDLTNAWEYEPSAEAFRKLSNGSNMVAVNEAHDYVIRAASQEMVLDKATYRPIRMLLHIGTIDVEIGEVATETLPLRETPLAEDHDAAIVPPAGHVTADLDLAEMMVYSRIHELKADLGEDVHVRKSGDAVLVSGVVAPDSRRLQLQTGLKGLPNVKVMLQSAEEAASGAKIRRVVDRSDEPNLAPLLQDWLQTKYPGDGERSNFVRAALDQADQCMWHSHALLALTQRYGELEDPTVHAIASDHLSQLQEEIASMKRWISSLPAVVDRGLENSPVIPNTVSGRVHLLEQTSRRLDEDLAELLTAHTQPPGSQEQKTEDALRLCHQHLELIDQLIQQLR